MHWFMSSRIELKVMSSLWSESSNNNGEAGTYWRPLWLSFYQINRVRREEGIEQMEWILKDQSIGYNTDNSWRNSTHCAIQSAYLTDYQFWMPQIPSSSYR